MKKALIVTDMQVGFINHNTLPIVEKIQRLLQKKLFKIVVFTKFINTKYSPYCKLLGFTKMQKDRETAIIPNLKPYAHVVFEKSSYSPFTSDFEVFLNENNIKVLYFVGVDTNACVQTGAVAAFEKGYIPYVLADYCASHSGKQFHHAAVENLKKLIGNKQVVEGELKALVE